MLFIHKLFVFLCRRKTCDEFVEEIIIVFLLLFVLYDGSGAVSV
jgi:hypothetical protein